ncbi:phosphoadenylylsulfate reductase (thioredoxin) [Mesocricetibacter intestinalis]|uniref:Adenosine 5'-phosphosulfate reductase n=1 Tax=Mesocricetibacter intestinalis TaxID=1521930 RepID=A0A4V3D9W6_9PAST|nr:phosphoadenylyl-sulfate reductase [Mesocricetibacter intestinalis]TDQ58972.1 phosphoadenylylsulfate reductase (thioredoxin) [Mesocricetibacter intestinalis]
MIERPNLWQIPQPDKAVLENLAYKKELLLQRLRQIEDSHSQVRFASSLAAEDMLITDLIARHGLNIGIFTLDTGLLPQETLDLLKLIERTYPDLKLIRFQPNRAQTQNFITEQGAQAYYESVELRRRCCFLRKIEPLNRALNGADAWLTGQRREQSTTRSELAFAERDNARNMDKYNPIFDWSEREVWAYILQQGVPYNRLYQQGYPSIGCDPCTRPIKQGEDIRAGRWWWENKDSKECGLHK